MIADINLNVTTVTMQPRRLHRQLLQSLRRRHGRFETGQATPPRSGPVRVGGPERRQPLPAYLALVVYRWPVWPPPALLPHAAEFRLPVPLMPLADATLLVHTLALPSTGSRAKLIHMRTFQSCGL